MKPYINRIIEKPFKEALEQFPVVLVTGPRQAGKSTLLQHVLKNYTYVTFDDIPMRTLAQEDPELFLKIHPAPLILDEIQYVPSLLSNIKIRVDQNRDRCGQYILTSSQIFSLMEGVTESLAGRMMIFHLLPLSYKELPQGDPFDLLKTAHQIRRGFFPELEIKSHLNFKFWHSAYLSTYVERDLKSIRNIHNLSLFQRFLTLLATRAGQLLNLNEIGKECGISQTTAKEWLTILQATSIIYLLEPYTRNLSKRVIKSPKLYFVDTGFLCYIHRIESEEQLFGAPLGGHIFENMVVMEKIKEFTNKGERAPCYFYRTSAGMEIDLLIDRGTSFDIYEIKSTASPTKEMASALISFSKEHPVQEAAVLNLRQDRLPFTEKVSALHWSVGIDSDRKRQ